MFNLIEIKIYMNKLISSLLFLFTISNLLSQSDFKVIVKGLKAVDSATVSVQRGSEFKFSKIVKDSDNGDVEVRLH